MARYEIEIDDSLIPKGFEPEAFHGLRAGDLYLSHCGKVEHSPDCQLYAPRLILRRKWQWPEAVKFPFLSTDSNGRAYFYEANPSRGTYGWGSEGSKGHVPWELACKLLGIDPCPKPPCPPGPDGWRYSLLRRSDYFPEDA